MNIQSKQKQVYNKSIELKGNEEKGHHKNKKYCNINDYFTIQVK